MIRNDSEYQEAVRRLTGEKERMAGEKASLQREGFSAEEVKRLTDPMQSFHLQLVEEVESYERLIRGEFAEMLNLHGLGQLLIGARISQGISQRELAQMLDVDESQVSRDERNEYHGITVNRASRILEVLSIQLSSHAERVRPVNAKIMAALKG